MKRVAPRRRIRLRKLRMLMKSCQMRNNANNMIYRRNMGPRETEKCIMNMTIMVMNIRNPFRRMDRLNLVRCARLLRRRRLRARRDAPIHRRQSLRHEKEPRKTLLRRRLVVGNFMIPWMFSNNSLEKIFPPTCLIRRSTTMLLFLRRVKIKMYLRHHRLIPRDVNP